MHYRRKTSFSMFESYSGSGYVYCAGDGQFSYLVASIQSIREVFKSNMPTQVFYAGDQDLSPSRQDYIRMMTGNIEIFNITQIFGNGYLQLQGWAIKFFALLASKFENAMLIDADVFFLKVSMFLVSVLLFIVLGGKTKESEGQLTNDFVMTRKKDPSELFDDPAFKEVGALFFYDRTLAPPHPWGEYTDFMRSMMPIMSSFPDQSRSFRGTSSFEQESRVVVINNKQRFLGMMATCKMNSK